MINFPIILIAGFATVTFAFIVEVIWVSVYRIEYMEVNKLTEREAYLL